ncbi:hypothetical protein ACGH7X_41790 [Streptomyces sp. BBFR51]|uniref:hypothetical protein n=1 Tax=Streptomyces sp. BBFR51 TaxID=3372856 RepID=UPI0037DDDC00
MTVLAYTIDHAAGPIQARGHKPAPLGPLGPLDVALTHTGICQTDLGMIDDHYGQSRFPFVPGPRKKP